MEIIHRTSQDRKVSIVKVLRLYLMTFYPTVHVLELYVYVQAHNGCEIENGFALEFTAISTGVLQTPSAKMNLQFTQIKTYKKESADVAFRPTHFVHSGRHSEYEKLPQSDSLWLEDKYRCF